MFEVIRGLMANGDEVPDYPNVYYQVDEDEITTSETRLGYSLPEQLKTFHREIGYAFFISSNPKSFKDNVNYINRFLAPSQIADLLLNEDEESRSSEGFDDGEIPFFEVGDQLYLVLRRTPTHSNQVAWPFGDPICDDLVDFTIKLAANPRFYHERTNR